MLTYCNVIFYYFYVLTRLTMYGDTNMVWLILSEYGVMDNQ